MKQHVKIYLDGKCDGIWPCKTSLNNFIYLKKSISNKVVYLILLFPDECEPHRENPEIQVEVVKKRHTKALEMTNKDIVMADILGKIKPVVCNNNFFYILKNRHANIIIML